MCGTFVDCRFLILGSYPSASAPYIEHLCLAWDYIYVSWIARSANFSSSAHIATFISTARWCSSPLGLGEQQQPERLMGFATTPYIANLLLVTWSRLDKWLTDCRVAKCHATSGGAISSWIKMPQNCVKTQTKNNPKVLRVALTVLRNIFYKCNPTLNFEYYIAERIS